MMKEHILLSVTKPSRYVGNEINMVKKDISDKSKVSIRFGFCFPDVYEVAMSHLGMQILYFFLNRREDTYCERIFTPWIDMEKIMREENIPLTTLETFTNANELDFLGFTLQYEMSYSNILTMLELSNIPFYSKDRDDSFPIIIAGGPCAYNPEPLADIVDFFYLGEGEVCYDEILDRYKCSKENNMSKDDFLKSILDIEGVYVPKFYEILYNKDNTINSINPTIEEAPKTVKKVILTELTDDYFPEKQLVPLTDVVHDRVTLELFRGCIRGCRFCQAGFVYRPVREQKCDKLLDISRKLIDASGHEEISLVSLSTSDYSEFQGLAEGLLDEFKDEKVNISLPSLRIDSFSLDLIDRVQKGRKTSLTFAPEAGTQRLRDVINKGITESDILDGATAAYAYGLEKIKLYFMIGLPTETREDLVGISELSEAIVERYYTLPKGKRGRGVGVTLSTACFVPKPFTPFQWEPQNTYEEFMEKQQVIRSTIKRKQIRYNYHDANLSFMEGVIARGDRKLSAVIIKAYELGARFDGWTEHYKHDVWLKAFEEVGIDPKFYSSRKREFDEVLPWDMIDIGVTKEYLIKEAKKAYNEEITKNCKEQCHRCGAESFGGGICHGR